MQISVILLTFGALCALFLTGCAMFKNTPKQDYVWDMAARCRVGHTGAYVSRVDADGRWWIYATGQWEIDQPRLQACMSDQFRATPYRQWLEQHKTEYDAAALR